MPNLPTARASQHANDEYLPRGLAREVDEVVANLNEPSRHPLPQEAAATRRYADRVGRSDKVPVGQSARLRWADRWQRWLDCVCEPDGAGGSGMALSGRRVGAPGSL